MLYEVITVAFADGPHSGPSGHLAHGAAADARVVSLHSGGGDVAPRVGYDGCRLPSSSGAATARFSCRNGRPPTGPFRAAFTDPRFQDSGSQV